jgi:hypothetical protein
MSQHAHSLDRGSSGGVARLLKRPVVADAHQSTLFHRQDGSPGTCTRLVPRSGARCSRWLYINIACTSNYIIIAALIDFNSCRQVRAQKILSCLIVIISVSTLLTVRRIEHFHAYRNLLVEGVIIYLQCLFKIVKHCHVTLIYTQFSLN